MWIRREHPAFWTKIVAEVDLPAFTRRAAIIQFFIRHSFRMSLEQWSRFGVNNWFQEDEIKELGTFFGALPLTARGSNLIVTLEPRLPDGNRSLIYLSFRSGVDFGSVRGAILGMTSVGGLAIDDVAAVEIDENGVSSEWKRYSLLRGWWKPYNGQ
jgi:hypothetical protein